MKRGLRHGTTFMLGEQLIIVRRPFSMSVHCYLSLCFCTRALEPYVVDVVGLVFHLQTGRVANLFLCIDLFCFFFICRLFVFCFFISK